MALSGSAYTAFARHRLVVEWSATQSIANNESTVTAKVYLQSMDQYGKIIASATNSGSVTVNGVTKTFTANSALEAYQKKLLTTQTFTVPHNADGSKTFNFSATYNVNVTFNGVKYNNQTASGSGTLNNIPRASTITTFNNFTIGNNIPWAVDRKHSSYVHRVQLWVGSTVIASSDSSSDSGTLTITSAMKTQMLQTIPNATSLTATLRVTTYSNSNYNVQIGSTQPKTATGTVGSDIIPSIGGLTAVEYVSNISTKIGAFVQGYSRLTLAITGEAGNSGSTIKSYRITGAGNTINAKSGTTGIINQSGNITFTATVTDSRNRTATRTLVVNVIAYTPPKINSYSVARTNSAGNPLWNGTYAKTSWNVGVANLNSKNTILIQLQRMASNASTWSTYQTYDRGVKTSDSGDVTNSGFDATLSYAVRVLVTDILGGQSSRILAIPTATVALDIGEDTVGVGKLWEKGTIDAIGQIYQNNGNKVLDESDVVSSNDTSSGLHGKIPRIKTDGVMEVGQYIDFHNSGTNVDYTTRLMTDGANNLSIHGKGRILTEPEVLKIYSQGVNVSGKTSNGGDVWIGNPGTDNALLVVNLRSVNGVDAASYRINTYLNGTAAYIRLFNSSGAVMQQANITYNYVIYLL